MDHVNNYTLGRGKVYLGRETTYDQFSQVGERYCGNSPALSINMEAATLDHFSSDGGINELDGSVTTQINRSGTLQFDDISADNLVLFFLGNKVAVQQTAVAVAGETITNVLPGLFYQLGATAANPQGVRGVTAVTVKTGTTTHEAGTDYEVDPDTGRIFIEAGGAIAAGATITVGYTPIASVRDRVISGSTPIRGRLRYVEDNPAGLNRTFLLPLVEITPNGDFDLKGDGWRNMPFNLKVLKRSGMEAVYIDGIPQVAAP